MSHAPRLCGEEMDSEWCRTHRVMRDRYMMKIAFITSCLLQGNVGFESHVCNATSTMQQQSDSQVGVFCLKIIPVVEANFEVDVHRTFEPATQRRCHWESYPGGGAVRGIGAACQVYSFESTWCGLMLLATFPGFFAASWVMGKANELCNRVVRLPAPKHMMHGQGSLGGTSTTMIHAYIQYSHALQKQ